MAEAETAPDSGTSDSGTPEPEIAGAPIGTRKPDAPPAPITNPDIPELQDRRRPRS